MVHMLGGKLIPGKAPHVPKQTVVMNISKADDSGNAITIKTGYISVSADRYRVWYQPLFKVGEEHQVVLTSPDLTLDRARALALKQGELLAFQIDIGLGQLIEDAKSEQQAKSAIDAAIVKAGG
jgi:hypothetical protein